MITKVVRRATGRAVCLALAEGLTRFGVPQELLTDNGKQFTDRFGKGGEVLFDRICRENGIVHRLTKPASPTTTGKVERFHQTLRRELLDDAGVFADLAAAQAGVDKFRDEYNTCRPHQALEMAFPADRFTPATGQTEQLVPVKLPAFLSTTTPETTPAETEITSTVESTAVAGAVAGVASASSGGPAQPVAPVVEYHGGPVEFDRVVPPAGNLQVAGKQFWLGPARAGVRVTLWTDTDVIHLLVAGTRIKSLRSHLSAADLTRLAANGGRPAGPPPVPSLQFTGTVEIDRTVSNAGVVSIGQHIVLAAEILRGRRVSVRIEQHTLVFFDPDTRQVLRTRPNPLTAAEVTRLRGARPAGPAPHPAHDRATVQRRASNSGVIMVVGQKVALGRVHAGKTLTVHVGDTDLVIDCDDGPRTIRRTTTQPVRSIKAHRPRKVDPET